MGNYEERNRSRARVHFKARGQPYGVYTWSSKRRKKAGVVVRVGPLGHVQLQVVSGIIVGKVADKRRGKHAVAIHYWGKSGRRRKVGVELAIFI